MKKAVTLLLLFTLVLSLCACGEISPAPAESSTPSESGSPADPSAPVESEAPEDPIVIASEAPVIPEDIVVTVFEKSGDYTDSLGEECHFSYRVPVINAETEEARRLNDAIYEQLMSVVDEELNCMEGGVSLVSTVVDYTCYVNNGIVSILCKADSPDDFFNYWVYNYDVESGREFTRADFLAREGLTDDELISLASSVCEKKFTEVFGGFPHDSFYEEQYAKTTDPASYGDGLMLYYGEDGALSMVAPIYSLAGASFYYQEMAVR